jgi:3',5'-cyclic AMP phosphodiesterase CpdA
MLIAHITDLHLRTDGRKLKELVDSEACLAALIDHVRKLAPRPDCILATGDLANKAEARDYVALRTAFERLEIPVYVIPGNHDDRALMRAAFANWGYLPTSGEFLHYAVERWPLRLIGLDTVIAGEDGGALCVERLAWLEARLAEQPNRPTLVFMHHPPFATGIGFMDKLAFHGGTELDALLRRFSNVEAVVCGHMHRPIHKRFGGTLALVAPSTVFQMSLDLIPGAPSSFVLEPAGVPLYVWTPEAGLVCHLGLVGDFGPRHLFHVEAAAGGGGPAGKAAAQ